MKTPFVRMIALWVAGVSSWCLAGDEKATAAAQPISMRLELELSAPRCAVMENFTLVVRITNPNDYAVELPGFDFGYIEPEIQMILQDGTVQRVFLGDTAARREPVQLAAHGKIEFHRFLFDSFGVPRPPIEPGPLRLTAKPPATQARKAGEPKWTGIEWISTEAAIRVDPMIWGDRQAMEFLRRALEANPRQGADSNGNASRIKLFEEFLDKHAESAYAPEIRWQLVKLLPQQIGEQQGPFYKDARMISLLDECLRFCLARGGAFAEEFTRWNGTDASHQLVEFAALNNRPELLEAMVREIDRRYPEDTEAIMYRRVLVAGFTKSLEDAQRVAGDLKAQFPEGRYAKETARALRNIERERGKRANN